MTDAPNSIIVLVRHYADFSHKDFFFLKERSHRLLIAASDSTKIHSLAGPWTRQSVIDELANATDITFSEAMSLLLPSTVLELTALFSEEETP